MEMKGLDFWWDTYKYIQFFVKPHSKFDSIQHKIYVENPTTFTQRIFKGKCDPQKSLCHNYN